MCHLSFIVFLGVEEKTFLGKCKFGTGVWREIPAGMGGGLWEKEREH